MPKVFAVSLTDKNQKPTHYESTRPYGKDYIFIIAQDMSCAYKRVKQVNNIPLTINAMEEQREETIIDLRLKTEDHEPAFILYRAVRNNGEGKDDGTFLVVDDSISAFEYATKIDADYIYLLGEVYLQKKTNWPNKNTVKKPRKKVTKK